jgi:hypothetical protein
MALRTDREADQKDRRMTISRASVDIFFIFYSAIVVLTAVLADPVKPLDPIQEHGNEHILVDLTEYSAYCAFQGLPVREINSLDLLFEKTKEEEVTQDKVRAISRLCYRPGFRGLKTIIGRA